MGYHDLDEINKEQWKAKEKFSFRTPTHKKLGLDDCWYCGSWSCDALYIILKNNLHLGPNNEGRAGGSDWKYGYPHKFYVDAYSGEEAEFYYEIPIDEERDKNRALPPSAKELTEKDRTRFHIPEKEFWLPRKITTYLVSKEDYMTWDGSKGVGQDQGKGMMFGKFYTNHLADWKGDPRFSELCDLIEKVFGIKFHWDEEKGLAYQAPYHGYQR